MSDFEYLKTQLEYKDGNLYWLVSRGLAKAGARAGYTRPDGYRVLMLKNKKFLEHRLIFYFFNGWMPEQIDHIDGDPTNNRIENLRAATQFENMQNLSKVKTNSSGFTGVHWHTRSKKWMARIRINGERINLGQFDNAEEASEAYKRAKLELHTFNPVARGEG